MRVIGVSREGRAVAGGLGEVANAYINESVDMLSNIVWFGRESFLKVRRRVGRRCLPSRHVQVR